MKTWNPKPYQVKAVQHMLYNGGAGLFLEPGLGKTSCALATLEILKEQKLPARTLIVAPLRVCYSVWPAEIRKWGSSLTYAIVHGTAAARALALQADVDVYLINPEGLAWLSEVKHKKFDVVVLDESTKFKNARTQRYAALEGVVKDASRVYILTGTPAANNLQDVWAQIKLLDGGERLGRFITPFRKKYFDVELVRIGGGQTIEVYHPRSDTAERIKERIKDICLYMSAEDYLTLPPLVVNRVDVRLPANAQRAYDDMIDELETELASGVVSASTAAVRMNKLRQMVGGAVYDEASDVHHIHDVKLDALVDLIGESNGSPVLVAVAFQHEAERIQGVLGPDVPYLGGGISAKASDAIATRWNAGELPVLLAHPASVAHGLNLQAGGNTVVWYTLTWSLEEYEQFNRRVYRQGQDKPVFVHHLIATDTVDEHVYETLQSKDRTQKSLLNLLKEVVHAPAR